MHQPVYNMEFMNQKPKLNLIDLSHDCELKSTIGKRYVIVDPQYKYHFLEEMYCIGISPEGLLQLSKNPESPHADLYLSPRQCKLSEP